MRIPSALTEETLYRRRRSIAPVPQRQLLRLALVAFLVILVIRQAKNPAIYETFFPSGDSPPAGQSPSLTSESMGSEGAEAASFSPSSKILGQPQPRLTTSGASNDGSEHRSADDFLAERISRSVTGLTDEETAKLLEIIEQIEEGTGPSRTTDETRQSDLARLKERIPELRTEGAIELIARALDRRLLQQVDKGAVWKNRDRLAFYRFLRLTASDWQSGQSPIRASVVSLLQQPELYLQQRILLTGTVARSIRHPADPNVSGITSYWELWIRPSDGGERPAVFFTASVPSSVAAVGPNQTTLEGPPVLADGLYLKRVGYRSSAGAELAPALVGELIVSTDQTGSRLFSARSISWWKNGYSVAMIVAAAMTGLLLALIVFYRSQLAAIRSSRLRQSTLPDPTNYLVGLEAGRTAFTDTSRKGKGGDPK
jgi:hypothetical protein